MNELPDKLWIWAYPKRAHCPQDFGVTQFEDDAELENATLYIREDGIVSELNAALRASMDRENAKQLEIDRLQALAEKNYANATRYLTALAGAQREVEELKAQTGTDVSNIQYEMLRADKAEAENRAITQDKAELVAALELMLAATEHCASWSNECSRSDSVNIARESVTPLITKAKGDQ